MLAPDVGTHEIVITWDGPVRYRNGGGISLYNVAQQPPEAVQIQSMGEATTISTSVITQTNGAWLVDTVGSGNAGDGFTTTGEHQVERYDTSAASSAGAGSTMYAPLPGQYTMGWTQDANRLAHVVAAFAPTVPGPSIAPPFFVNFQPSWALGYPDYGVDSGEEFGYRANGLVYGWNQSNSHNRDRNSGLSQDQRYDTLNHMQKPDNPNAYWEIAVPNGYYQVRVVAGDPGYIDSVYKIAVEGTIVIDAVPSIENRWFDESVVVEVADGALTISNAAGSANNKINFVAIDPDEGL